MIRFFFIASTIFIFTSPGFSQEWECDTLSFEPFRLHYSDTAKSNYLDTLDYQWFVGEDSTIYSYANYASDVETGVEEYDIMYWLRVLSIDAAGFGDFRAENYDRINGSIRLVFFDSTGNYTGSFLLEKIGEKFSVITKSSLGGWILRKCVKDPVSDPFEGFDVVIESLATKDKRYRFPDSLSYEETQYCFRKAEPKHSTCLFEILAYNRDRNVFYRHLDYPLEEEVKKLLDYMVTIKSSCCDGLHFVR